MILMSVGPDIEKMWACLKANMNLMMSKQQYSFERLVGRTNSRGYSRSGAGGEFACEWQLCSSSSVKLPNANNNGSCNSVCQMNHWGFLSSRLRIRASKSVLVHKIIWYSGYGLFFKWCHWEECFDKADLGFVWH